MRRLFAVLNYWMQPSLVASSRLRRVMHNIPFMKIRLQWKIRGYIKHNRAVWYCKSSTKLYHNPLKQDSLFKEPTCLGHLFMNKDCICQISLWKKRFLFPLDMKNSLWMVYFCGIILYVTILRQISWVGLTAGSIHRDLCLITSMAASTEGFSLIWLLILPQASFPAQHRICRFLLKLISSTVLQLMTVKPICPSTICRLQELRRSIFSPSLHPAQTIFSPKETHLKIRWWFWQSAV